MAGNLGSRIARVDVIIGGVQQAKAQLKEMEAQMKQYAETAEKARKAMEASTGTVAYDRHKKEYEDAQKNQKQLERAIRISQQNINTVDKYLQDISGQTLRNLQAAQRTMRQALLSVDPKDTEGLSAVRGFITQIADEIKRRKGDLLEFSDIIGDIGNVSDRSLSMARQRLQDLIASTKLNSDEMAKYRQQLKLVEEEQQRRISSDAGKVMGNLSGSSLNEIQEAIKATTQLRDAQKLGSEGWEIYNDEIQRAQQYLADFNNLGRQLSMSDRMKELGKASTDSLAELRKFWQEQADGAERGSQELAEYEKNLKRVINEQQLRSEWNAYDVIDNIDDHSVGEIQNAVKALEQLREATGRGDAMWYAYGRRIDKAREYLESFARADREADMAKRMQSLGTASNASLAELRKFWQEQADGAEYASQEMQKFQDQLRIVQEEEQRRTASRAQGTISSVRSGTFDGSIADTKEAIKLLEQYKQQLKTSDTQGIRDADEAIQALNDRIRQATTSVMSLDDALEKSGQVGEGTFDGTYEDLQRLRQTLEEYQKRLKVGDTQGLEEIQSALQKIEDAQKKVSQGTVDINSVMKNLRTAPLEQLQKAAAQLQRELTEAERGTEDYIRTSAQLRQVNGQIDRVKKSWEEHDSQIVATAKRLTSYVLVYAGFNEVVGRIKQLTQANLELSDSLANIQKTTGLTSEEVAELSREIDSLDTRATQQELHDLAYEAGKLGISAEEDVLSFVKAGNQVITALGDELGGADAVRNLMKINDLLGETSRLGVEKALLATGSAMNELSNVSTASAGPISEIVSRLGAVGAQANLSMADLIALGGTADELSQEIEVSGTALSKFVTALQTNTHAIAQAIGVDDKELENLMETGKTMEAIILVLRQVRGMGGLKEIDPIMKEFGSDGERLDRVVTALASNVDTLEKRVRQSREAFSEATSVTNEYNVMNESAIALAQRLGNMIMEKFVNSGFVEWLRNLLKVLMDIPYWIERNAVSFGILVSAVSGLTAALIANRIQWIANLQKMGAVEIFSKAAAAIRSLGTALVTTTTYTGLLTKGVNGLKTALKTNWLTALIGVVVTVGTAFYQWATHVDKLAKATGEFSAQLTKERMQVDALFNGLRNANMQTEERVKLIDQINDRYGELLGFMLSEKDSADMLASAYDLINAKLRERMALQLQAQMNESTASKYGSAIQDAMTGMNQSFAEAPGITEARASEASSLVQDIVSRNISRPLEEILTMVMDELSKRFDTEKATYGAAAYFDIQSDLKDFINAQKEYHQEIAQTKDFVEGELKAANEELVSSSIEVLNQLAAEYNTLKKVSTASMDERQLREHNQQILKTAQEYVNVGGKLTESLSGMQRKQLEGYVEQFRQVIKELTPQSEKSINVWGEGLTLETASVNQLVGKYKELHNERKTMKEDADYETVYSKQFRNRVDAMKWYLDEMSTIKKRLNDMGYDEYGNLLKDNGRGRSRSYSYNGAVKTAKEIKEEATAALSALQAYFNKEKEIINRAYLDEEITEEEKNRRLYKKEEEALRDRVALRQRLLGRKGGENFNPEKYVHTDAETGETTEYFKGKDLGQLSGFIHQMGQAMTDGMLNQLTVDELKIQQAIVERFKNIQKIILDNDFTGQVDKQYQDQLEALELFWGKEEEVTKEGADRRLAYLRVLSKDSYEMDYAGLEQRMAKYGEFSEWMQNRSAEDYQALLVLLQKYYDDTEEAENREIARRQRLTDRKWEKSGQKKSWEDTEDVSEHEVTFMSSLQGLGLASDDMVDDAELNLYRTRLAAAQAYYEFVQENGGNMLEAEQKRNEAMVELSQKEMEITKGKMETLKSYTDAVVDFAGQMGEAAFSEVSDRKEAARQLLQTTMKLTKDLIMQKLTELIMKKALNQQEVSQEAATQASIQATKGATEIANLTATGAKMAGDVAGGIASGGAKTVGELGWWGIPLIAVISAALSALMGMAMGKINQAKQEVATATGASNKGRVAARMLTYAEGDYPVLGNDGHIYNARYQRELKTGVYRGGAHFGIFSEKKPEMIVDGDTTQKLVLNYPHIYESILTIARHGQLKRAAMPVFAAGSYPAVPGNVQAGQAGAAADASGQNLQMQETLAGLQTAVAALTDRLSRPISATVDPYGSKGAVKQLDKASRFMQKRGLI